MHCPLLHQTFSSARLRTLERLVCLALLAGFFSAASAVAAAAPAPAVIDGQGRVFQLLTGTYGALFAKSGEAAADDPVLALEVFDPKGEGPAGQVQRRLVPGSVGASLDGLHVLTFEEASGTVFVLWQRPAAQGAALLLTGLQAGEWTVAVEVARVAHLTGEPLMQITRDSYTLLSEAGERSRVERSFLHLLWHDAGGQSVEAGSYYSPVLFENGRYLGWNPIVALNDLDDQAGEGVAGPGEAALAQLARRPVLEAASDGQAVIAAFTHRESGRFLTVEIRVLPGGLAPLARNAGRLVLEKGAETSPGDLESLAGGVGSAMIDVGIDFHLSSRSYFAFEAQATLLDAAENQAGPGLVLQSLADKVGSAMIDVGAKMFGSDGVDRNYLPGRLHLLEIPRAPAAGEAPPIYEADPPHLVRLYVTANLPAPQVAAGAPSVFVSGDGARSLVSWQTPDAVHFRESGNLGWGEERSLPLSSGLDRGRIEQILRERVRR